MPAVACEPKVSCLLLKEPFAVCGQGLAACLLLIVPPAVHKLDGAGSLGITKVERMDSPGQCKFRFHHMVGRSQHRKDGAVLQTAWEEGSTQGLSLQPSP